MSNHIDREGHQHIDTEDARAGSNNGMRYVLMASLVLVVIVFAAIYLLT